MLSFAPELSIVLLLIVLNGAFAMAEMAAVSSRKVRLEQLAASGNQGARVALDLAAILVAGWRTTHGAPLFMNAMTVAILLAVTDMVLLMAALTLPPRAIRTTYTN